MSQVSETKSMYGVEQNTRTSDRGLGLRAALEPFLLADLSLELESRLRVVRHLFLPDASAELLRLHDVSAA